MKMNEWKVIGIAVLILWLCCSSTIIGRIYNSRNGIETVPDIEVMEDELTPMCFSVDAIKKEDNLFDSIRLEGWAVCPGTEGEEDQIVSVFLQSDKKSYEISADGFGRSDLILSLAKEGIGISGSHHGFQTSFCPYPFSDGEYDISLLCKENDRIIGKEMTGYMLEKKRGRIEISERMSETITGVDLKEPVEGQLRMYTDYAGMEGEIFLVRGWMYLKEESSSSSEKYAEVIMDDQEPVVYQLSSYSRADLSSIAGEKNAGTAGFDLKIPREAMRDCREITIVFYMIRDGEVYGADPNKTITCNLGEDE